MRQLLKPKQHEKEIPKSITNTEYLLYLYIIVIANSSIFKSYNFI